MNPTPDQAQRLAEKLLPMFREMDRLKALSSMDLIKEVLNSPEGDSLRVTELMDRVLPGWMETIGEEERT